MKSVVVVGAQWGDEGKGKVVDYLAGWFDFIARRAGQKRVIPAGSTYKIRGGKFTFNGARVLPSYLQAGPSFFIEKSKRRMIAEDIATGMRLAHA